MILKRLRKSLTLKWMVFSILLATIPLTIAGFQIIQIYQKNLKESIIEIEKEKAHIIIERNRSLFEMVTSNLLFLTKGEGFKMNNPSRMKRHLENLLHHHYYLVELTLFDERGKETVRVSKFEAESRSSPIDHSKSEMFEVASKGQIFYKDLFSHEDIYPTVIVGVPIEKYLGKRTGVLCAKIYLRYLWHLIPQTLSEGRDSTYVMSKDGFVVAYPDTSKALLGPFIDRDIAEEEGVLELENLQGEKYLVVHKSIKELGWRVVVQVPLEEAYAPIRQVTYTALQLILITLGIAALVSLLLTRKFTRPIKRLSLEMTRVARGDLDTYIPASTQDEVGVLTESFNQMIQDLRQSQEALKEAESKYRNIFKDSKDMVYITSVDGRFIDVNQAGVEMFGFETKEELMETPVRDLYFDSEERNKFRSEIAKDGFIKDFEAKLKRRDGTPIDVLITANIRKNNSDHIIGYEGNIKNISARKKMEKELLQRKEELQILYDLGILINQTLDIDNFLPIVLDRVSSLTGFEMGGIYLLNEIERTLELKFHKGNSPFLAENTRILKSGEGVAGKAVTLKKPVYFSIEEYPFPRIIPFLKKERVQTVAGIPLLAKGKAIGAITLSSRFEHGLNQKEINLLESIGNQIGMALENARLFSIVAKAKTEWETTFDAVTDLITIRDNDYRILRANKVAFKRYGLTSEAMIGRRCYEVFHHRDAPCEECYVAETLRTKKPTSGERESDYLKGIFRYFTFPVHNEAGEVIAVVDLAQEVTEEKRLEQEKEVINNINKILASSLDVRQVFEAVHSELKRVVHSERMTITLLNEEKGELQYFAIEKDYDAQELMEGITYPLKKTPSEEVAQTGLPIIVSDTEKESNYWISEKLLKEEIRSYLVFPLEYKGKIFGTMNLGSKEPNHFSEKQLGLLQQIASGLAISIQNSLLLEEMKQSEKKYRTVVEGVHDGVAVVGMDYKFKYVNRRLEEILGHTREELIGMDFRNLLAEESKPFVAELYKKWVRGDEMTPVMEFNFLHKNGEIRHMEISNKEMRDSEGNLNFVAIMRDITKKKMMEEQLIQNEKLRSLGEMASGVAHDFNNALAAILGNTQLLLYTVQDEGVRESLQTIEKVTRDSAQTVRRLQDFTRKKTHQELFNLDINSIVKDAIEITRPKWKDEAQGKGIHIEMVLNLREVPSVNGIASELREVITNMIFNAVEAMPNGGKIEIQTFQKKERICVEISDTGIGMVEEMKKKIFEPFFTTKPFSNTGLGLSVSYGIIHRLGGEIKVESKFGKGTTFTISLPVGLDGKDELILPPVVKKGKEARILVVDDEESIRSVLARTLSQVNHKVTVAENGEKGIQLFKEGKFDMVLTDLGMPGMSGWEVCRMVKEINPQTPVGMITGWGVELSQTEIEENKLDFLISKPFDFNQILNIVAETMESRKKRLLS